MKSTLTYLSYCFFFFILSVNAQHGEIVDTLTVKGALDNKLQQALKNYKFSEALIIADSIEHYSIATKDTLFLAYAYDIKSTIYSYSGNAAKGKLYVRKMKDIYEQKKFYSSTIGSYSMWASLLRKEGKVDSSLYVLNKAQKYLSDSILVDNITFFYNQKALSHYTQGRVDSSLLYSFKRLDYLKKENDPYKVHFVYKELSNTFHSLKDYENALTYIDKSIETIGDNNELKISKANALIAKGNINLHLNEFIKARENLNEALSLLGSSGRADQKAKINILKSQILIKENKLTESLKLLNQIDYNSSRLSNQTLFDLFNSQATIEQLNKNWSSISQLLKKLDPLNDKISDVNRKQSYYELKTNYYGHVGDYENGYEAQKNYIETSNKIKNRQQTYIVYDLENKYQLSKKDEEIALQQLQIQADKKKFQISILVGILLSVIILGVILFYRQRQIIKNKEIEKLKAEQDISKLEALIEGEEKERKRLAQDLHDGINGDLAVIKYKISSITDKISFEDKEKNAYKSAINMLDNAIEQVRNISHNLAPPSLQNFNLIEALQQYCTKITSSSNVVVNFQNYGQFFSLNKKVETAIYRIVQEAINNIVKHSKATEALVQINNHNDTINITIEDNGIGFKSNEKNEGLGLKNIRSRVDLLKGDLTIDSNKEGTSINIDISLKEHNND